MGRKSRTRRRKSPLWAKAFVFFGTILMVLGFGGVVAAKKFLDSASNSIEQLSIGGNEAMITGEPLKGPLTILLVGLDDGQASGGGEVRAETAHADSILIMYVPASHDQAYLMSLPRDLWVSIPGHEQGKLNAAYTFGAEGKTGSKAREGGLDLLMRTIFATPDLGFKFNAAMTVNFSGFTQAVKELGGVTMNIDEKVTSVHYGTDKSGKFCYPATFDAAKRAYPVPGCQGKVYAKQQNRRLTPVEALDYTRQREWMELDDGDYGRQRHQRQFIKALVREGKAQGMTVNPAKGLQFIKAVGGAVSMWTNGRPVEDWFFTLKDIAGGDVGMLKTNNDQFHEVKIGDQSTEGMTEDTLGMFKALRENKLVEYAAQHPQILGSDG